MSTKSVIGVDLGGTAIKLGRFLENGTCIAKLTIPTPQPSTPKAVLDAIAIAVNQLNPEKDCLAMGIGTPGPSDAQGRVARIAINLANWHNVPVADWLEAKTGLATVVANDTNCAGLGEAWLGAGQKFANLILLTLGTGVGGAIILNGNLFTGHLGAAGELGLITLNPEGPYCNSGNQGSLEQYLSVSAIIKATGLQPFQLAEMAEQGDIKALAFWQEYGKKLGQGLASLIYVLTPEAVIIGGGVSASAKFFFPSTVAEIQRRVLPCSREGLELLSAELGNQAGMIGAARLALAHPKC